MFDVDGSPWSIWINGEKIVKDIPAHIYNKVHGPSALQHWEMHGKFPNGHEKDINWEGVGRTKKQSPYHDDGLSPNISQGCAGWASSWYDGKKRKWHAARDVANMKMRDTFGYVIM